MVDDSTPTTPRSRYARGVVLFFMALAFLGFCALGTWQIQRLFWKLDLIERVDSRVHAAPVAPPPDWANVSALRDEYKHVQVEGRYLQGLDTRVDALTDLGAGDWILSPLQMADGRIVLVNRGFVPKGEQVAAAPGADVTVQGLLRITEPQGRTLRANQPEADRWFSRDVQAITAQRRLNNVAPYFVDADSDKALPPWPKGGMTVVQFRNAHLSYALTWFALALLAAFAFWRFSRP